MNSLSSSWRRSHSRLFQLIHDNRSKSLQMLWSIQQVADPWRFSTLQWTADLNKLLISSEVFPWWFQPFRCLCCLNHRECFVWLDFFEVPSFCWYLLSQLLVAGLNRPSMILSEPLDGPAWLVLAQLLNYRCTPKRSLDDSKVDLRMKWKLWLNLFAPFSIKINSPISSRPKWSSLIPSSILTVIHPIVMSPSFWMGHFLWNVGLELRISEKLTRESPRRCTEAWRAIALRPNPKLMKTLDLSAVMILWTTSLLKTIPGKEDGTLHEITKLNDHMMSASLQSSSFDNESQHLSHFVLVQICFTICYHDVVVSPLHQFDSETSKWRTLRKCFCSR